MNIIQSIWNYKCPRCRKGDLYTKPFRFKKPLDMNKHCDHCGLDFQPEPGYYFGAMFVSYIWTAFLCVAIVGFCLIILGWSLNASFALLIAVCLLSYFFVLRISRAMYIHLDTKYDPTKKDT